MNKCEELEQVLSKVNIINFNSSWCCQDWVYDAMRDLNAARIISDYDLENFKQKLNLHLWRKIEKKWECCNCEIINNKSDDYCSGCEHEECGDCPDIFEYA